MCLKDFRQRGPISRVTHGNYFCQFHTSNQKTAMGRCPACVLLLGAEEGDGERSQSPWSGWLKIKPHLFEERTPLGVFHLESESEVLDNDICTWSPWGSRTPHSEPSHLGAGHHLGYAAQDYSWFIAPSTLFPNPVRCGVRLIQPLTCFSSPSLSV